MGDPLETTKAGAEAASEIAKTTGKAIDALSGVSGFFDRVFGGLVVDSVGLVADRVRLYRYERAIELSHAVERRLRLKGIFETRPVPLKVALPLIEAATLEDDDDLRERWANLLESAMNPDARKVERSFVTILSELSSEDASFFEFIWSCLIEAGADHGMTVYARMFPDFNNSEISVRNMFRLGLLKQYVYYIMPRNRKVGETEIVVRTAKGEEVWKDLLDEDEYGLIHKSLGVPVLTDSNQVRLTPLGQAFGEAVGCRRRS